MDLTRKPILVTGGAGFLGSHLTGHLRALGCTPLFTPRRRECDLTRAEDDDPLEIDARPLGCERIERRRRIDPRHHPALSLRSGRGAQRERDLSHARWSDEGDRLAGSQSTADHPIERGIGRDHELGAVTLRYVAARERVRPIPPLDPS